VVDQADLAASFWAHANIGSSHHNTLRIRFCRTQSQSNRTRWGRRQAHSQTPAGCCSSVFLKHTHTSATSCNEHNISIALVLQQKIATAHIKSHICDIYLSALSVCQKYTDQGQNRHYNNIIHCALHERDSARSNAASTTFAFCVTDLFPRKSFHVKPDPPRSSKEKHLETVSARFLYRPHAIPVTQLTVSIRPSSLSCIIIQIHCWKLAQRYQCLENAFSAYSRSI